MITVEENTSRRDLICASTRTKWYQSWIYDECTGRSVAPKHRSNLQLRHWQKATQHPLTVGCSNRRYHNVVGNLWTYYVVDDLQTAWTDLPSLSEGSQRPPLLSSEWPDTTCGRWDVRQIRPNVTDEGLSIWHVHHITSVSVLSELSLTISPFHGDGL